MSTYYEILGIPIHASPKEVKQAYNRIAILHHPDKPGGDIKIYHQAREAYETLHDPIKRQSYDLLVSPKKESKPPKIRKGQDLKITIPITLVELAAGIEKNIAITRKGRCPRCDGSGSLDGMKQCPDCNGGGIDMVSLVFGPEKYCKRCRGYTNIPNTTNPCLDCNGTGIFSEVIQHKVRLNTSELGDSNTKIIPGSGNYCQGGSAGDLIIELNKERDDTYVFDGLNLRRTISISPAQAVLGDEITLRVLEKSVKVVIPPGTQHGSSIEKEGLGIESDSRCGNLILRVNIDIPMIVSPEETELYDKILHIEKGTINGRS